MKKLACLTIVLIFALSAAIAEDSPQYTEDSFARLSHINGNVYIQRATELDYEEAVVNMPLTEGDRMGTTEGRAEIYMGRGKYLRVDHDTKLDFLNFPGPVNDLMRIQIWKGNIIFSIMSLKKEKAIEIHTNDASLYVLEAGLFRIDVRGDETEIFVFRGLLEAAGETGSVLIREAQRLEATGGHFLGRPSGFVAVAEDSFDRWNEYRDNEVRKRMAQGYLPEELEDFEYELASYGYWTYIFPYGHVWVPSGMMADWRPYWHGRWIWIPVCGWTWLSYEPWGWVTGHFGRWHWSVGLGWYWIPTTAWGPGWVHWYQGYDYVAWAPASFWGRPGVIIDNVYYGRNTDNSYLHGSRALTVIHKEQLRARNISKVALSQNSIKNIEQLSLVKTQPNIEQTNSSKIRLKTLRDSSLSPETSPRVRIANPEKTESSEERNIPKLSSETKSKKTSSTLGKITSILSSGKSKTTKSGSSGTSSVKSSSSKTKTIKSSTISKSKSSSAVKKSSATRSGSKKVKKKK
jgi:hypothetical protein